MSDQRSHSYTYQKRYCYTCQKRYQKVNATIPSRDGWSEEVVSADDINPREILMVSAKLGSKIRFRPSDRQTGVKDPIAAGILGPEFGSRATLNFQ
jgi:hypothetical protein